MLPKINRIKKDKDFERIFKASKSFKGLNVIFRAIKNDLSFSRFAFVVSLKVSKKATARNKVRRRLAGIIRKNIKNIKPGIDLVIIALPNADKKKFDEFEKDVLRGLVKMGLI